MIRDAGQLSLTELMRRHPNEPLRGTLELDSLDLLAFVERLSERSGRRIEEDDYDKLDTLASCVRLLSVP